MLFRWQIWFHITEYLTTIQHKYISDCFTWVALVDSHLDTCALDAVPLKSVGWGPAALSGVGVLVMHILFKVVEHVVKECGHLIIGNSTYPIAFACALPSMIGPILLVTSNMAGNALLSICRCKTHDPRLYTDCPLYASICTLGGFKVSSHSWPNSCWALWVGRMLQPAPVSTSLSVWRIWDPWDCTTHSALMWSVSLLCIWWTFAVVLRHLTDAFAWSFVR